MMTASIWSKFVVSLIFWLFVRSGSSNDQKEISGEIGGLRFSFNLYNRLMHYNAINWCFSPFAVRIGLAMTSEKVQNDTASQLQSVLELNDFQSPVEMHKLYQSCLNSLFSNPQLKAFMATRIYVPRDFLIDPTINATINTYYRASVQNINFGSDPNEAAAKINLWIEHEMSRMFEDFIPPGFLSPDTELVLVNGVYFKGKWKTRFDPAHTKLLPFDPNYGPNRIVQVPTMYVKGQFKYTYCNALKSQILELPYEGDQLVMQIILPKKKHGHSIELHQKLVKIYMNDLKLQEVEVYLPKFVNSFKTELKSPLKSLGIVDAFTKNAYLFVSPNEPRLRLSAVFHQAVVIVDEEGAEDTVKEPQLPKSRSAKPGLAKPQLAKPQIPKPQFAKTPIEFRVNHPCTFIIYDLKYKYILFMGELLEFKNDKIL